MLKIDNTLLEEIGLGGLPEVEKNSFLKHVYETLEMRVGVRLADQMTNEQLDEFEQYFEAKDDAGAFKWLETNFPNYKDIVQQEFDKLKAEVAQSAPQILAASQTAAIQAGQPQSPGTQNSLPPAQPQTQPQRQDQGQGQFQTPNQPQGYGQPQSLQPPQPQGQPQTPNPFATAASAQPASAPPVEPPVPMQPYGVAPSQLPPQAQQQPYSPYPQQQPPAGPQQ
jgi:hypothetical protein